MPGCGVLTHPQGAKAWDKLEQGNPHCEIL